MKRMNIDEINESLTNLSGWAYEDKFIFKKFVFKDHISAFAFLSKVALIAERINHHPNWSGVYNEVLIKLSTHDVNDVTSKDFELAIEIENSF